MDENFSVTLTTTTEDATIYYYTIDIDGKTPEVETATEYLGNPILLTTSCKLVAIGVKKNFNTSEPTDKSFELPFKFDGDNLILAEAGITEKILKLFGADWDSLIISGPMNDEDLSYIRTLSSLRYLDMKQVKMENAELPDNAFTEMKLLVYESPADLEKVGRRLFNNCQELAAVIWNASAKLPDDAFGSSMNPNLLVYAKADEWIPNGVINRVVNGTAKKVVLCDGPEGSNTNFHCPEAFFTQSISYTHNYIMTTEKNVCRGWETIALPFTVQSITHEHNGSLTPFHNYNGGEYKPFWLYALTETGFVESDSIRAYEPYIISMPNNANYADSYILAGEVTFAATNVTIAETKPGISTKQDYDFVACFQRKQAAPNIWVINLGETYEDTDNDRTYVEGSVFVNKWRETRPFEAYKTSTTMNAAVMAIFDDDATGIINLPTDDMMNRQNVRVYNLNGTLVTQGERSEALKRLPKGLYIINGKKTLVK
jgi:hypothetical protein